MIHHIVSRQFFILISWNYIYRFSLKTAVKKKSGLCEIVLPATLSRCAKSRTLTFGAQKVLNTWFLGSPGSNIDYSGVLNAHPN
jgi:hypothetical protein